MTGTQRVVNLKQTPEFVDQYIDLRNAYAEALMTQPVLPEKTKEWLLREDIEIAGLVEDGVLEGVVILYLSRGNEIAFFARRPNRGTGSRLLDVAEEFSRRMGLESAWGWVWEGNPRARRVFEKKGFFVDGFSEREYNGLTRRGVVYRKRMR